MQDQASAFVVGALDPQPGDRVLDVCAAPGGKAAHVACLVGETGSVVAGDVRPERAALVAEHRRTARRRACSSWRRTPRGRRSTGRSTGCWSTRRARASGRPAAGPSCCGGRGGPTSRSLARLQVAIASAAADLLRPGGRLVYSVCTFPRAETDAACDALLRHRPSWSPKRSTARTAHRTRVRLWPHRHGSDGMFVAAFRETALTGAGTIAPMGMLSASILSADFAHLADQVKLVEPYAEVIHIDIMDAHFVPPLTIGPVVVASLRPVTERPSTGTSWWRRPKGSFDDLAEAGLDVVSFHHEAVADPAPVHREGARDGHAASGMTLNMETPGRGGLPVPRRPGRRDAHEHQAGWSGQTLDPEVYPRLEAVRAEVDRRGLSTRGGDRRRRQARQRPARDRRGRDGPRRGVGDLPGAGSAALPASSRRSRAEEAA